MKTHHALVKFDTLMKKAPNQPSWSGAWALSLAALFTACQSAPTRAVAVLDRLQGYWEGEGAGGKCSITITGNSLHYRAGTNWHETTFTLPAGTDPQQLHATIIDCWPPSNDAIGNVVFAIFKIEDETLTLAAYDPSEEPPNDFANAASRYVVKKVQRQKKDPEPLPAK